MSSIFCCSKDARRIELSSLFRFGKKIGRGGQGLIFLAQKKNGEDSGNLYAIKIINKEVFKKKCYTKESDILAGLANPFIIELHYAFQTSRHDFSVFPFHCGDNLYQFVVNQITKKISENHSRLFLAELVCAIKYLHSFNIIHGLVNFVLHKKC